MAQRSAASPSVVQYDHRTAATAAGKAARAYGLGKRPAGRRDWVMRVLLDSHAPAACAQAGSAGASVLHTVRAAGGEGCGACGIRRAPPARVAGTPPAGGWCEAEKRGKSANDACRRVCPPSVT